MAGKERIIGASKEAEVSVVPAGRDSRGGTNGEGGGGLPEQSGAGRARWGSGVRLFLLVVGVVGVATALRWALDPLFGDGKQFIAYYPAVAVAALVGGARAGMVATVLSAMAVALLFMEPRGSLIALGLSDWVALGLFVVAGGLMSWMAERVDRARRREAEAAERERAAEAVRRQAALLNLAHDAIFVRGTGDKITFWNSGAEETYGWSREEALGQVTHVLLKTRFPKPLAELSAEVAGKGQWEGELTHTRKDGREIVVASRWAAERDRDGRQIGVLEINRDITEGKRAEEELRGARGRLEEELKRAVRLRDLSTQLINGGGDQELYDEMLETAMAIMGADFASIQRAEEAADGNGWTLKLLAWKNFAPESARFWQVVGMGSATPCGAALRGGERCIIADVERCEFATGTPDLEECRRSGIRAMQSTPLISRAGRLLGMISTHWREPHEPRERELNVLDVLARQIADLVERRHQDERLRESEERFRAAFEQGASPMVLTVPDGTILRANPAFCRMLGYTEEEVQERTFLDITHPEDRAASRAGAERMARGEQAAFRTEKRYLRKDGQTVWGDVSVAVARDDQGRLIHFVTHVQDITAHKQAEANQVLLTDVLRILNRGGDLHSLTGEVLRVIREASGFDAAGLRLRQGEDYPYVEQSGFSQEFLREENFLCAKGPGAAVIRDAEGRPVLECTCGLVLSGRTDPKMSCFTQGGSFWTNVSKELLALAPKDDRRENPRNRCIHGGYQSVGLFPVRAGREIVGLLQLNDRRPGRFTPEMLAFYESLAQNIGLALQRATAEEALRASEARFRRVFSNDMVPMAVWAKNGAIEDANDALLELVGYTRADLEAGQLRWDGLTPAEYRQRDLEAVAEVEARGFCTPYEKCFRHKDGHLIPIVIGGGGYDDRSGKGVLFAVDITKRRRAEEALRESEERLAVAITGARMGMFEWDVASGELKGWEQAAQSVGLETTPTPTRTRTRTTLSQKYHYDDWAERVHPEDLPGVEAEMRRAELERGAYEAEYRVVWPDGSVHWLAARGVFQYDAEGQARRLLGILMDITRRKRAEEALHASEVFAHATIDALSAHVCVLDEGGRILLVNRAWRAFAGDNLGSAQGLAEGGNYLAICDAATGPDAGTAAAMAAGIRAVLKGQQEGFSLEYPCHSPVEQRWFVARVSRFPGPGPTRVVIAHEDVTQRKQAEEVLARSKVELERLVAERTGKLQELVGELEHFSYTITHDMRAPLRAMMGYAELMSRAGSSCRERDAGRFLELIKASASRMDALITDALQYSKAVRQELEVAPVDAGALLRGMLDAYPELQPSKARIKLRGEIPRVMGNAAGLTQCFSNLLGNAVKFVKPGEKPEIVIWAEVRGEAEEWVRIWVEDKGIGIPESMLPRVFDMFSRGHNEYEGTGIGLALVRKVVDRMGGRVGVESEEGKGSRFWIELKLGEFRPRVERSETRPAEAKGGTVLYVEDEQSDAMFMGMAFAEKGMESALRVVGDGRTAIEYLSGAGKYADRQEYPLPSVVLLDLNLPQVPGFGVLTWMRNHPDFARTPVVVFSSSTREDDRAKALELGANEFVGKPSSGLEFGEVVEGLRERWMGAVMAA